MGKGDKRTAKGKRQVGSFGISRKSEKNKAKAVKAAKKKK